MKRREFITGLAGAAAEPLAAWAQQPPRRIAVLLASDNSNPEDEARLNALLRGLQQLGRSDGHDVALDIRWAGGNSKQTEKIVAEVVAFAPEIIVSSGSVATAAFQ